MKPQRLLGVVLAGGQGSRMGRDKSELLHIDGRTFLEHAIERMTTICDAVYVSGPKSLATELRLIIDPVTFQGPAVGVAASLQVARDESFDACLFTPVDMPQLTTADLVSLKQAWQDSSDLTLGFCEAVQPLVGIYPISLADQINSLASSQNRSLFRWIKTQEFQNVQLPASSGRNVNTPDDLINGS